MILYRRTSITLPPARTVSAATVAHPTRKNSAIIFAVISSAISAASNATWSGVCKKLKDAPPVVVQRDRAQLPLRVIFLLFTTWPFDRRWHLDARAAITVGDPYRQRHLVAGYSAALRRLRSQTGTIHVGILRSCFEEPNSWGYP